MQWRKVIDKLNERADMITRETLDAIEKKSISGQQAAPLMNNAIVLSSIAEALEEGLEESEK